MDTDSDSESSSSYSSSSSSIYSSSSNSVEDLESQLMLSQTMSSNHFNTVSTFVRNMAEVTVLAKDQNQGHVKEKWMEDRANCWEKTAGYSDEKFRKKFKLSRQLFDRLAEKMPEHKDSNFRQAITKRHRLAICLVYLTKGSSLEVIADAYGVGKTTAVYALDEGISTINKELRFPSFSTEELHGIVTDFETRGCFKVCCG